MWQIYVDTGGTFTDCLAVAPDGTSRRLKVLSTSRLRGKVQELSGRMWQLDEPIACAEGLLRGFRASLGGGMHRRLWVEHYHPKTGLIEFNADPRIDVSQTVVELCAPYPAPLLAALLAMESPDWISAPPFTLYLATTRATNALLEKKGAKTALLVTRGHEDVLAIGNQQRPDLFALNIEKSELPVSGVFSVDERVFFDGKTGKNIDINSLERISQQLISQGFEAAAVSFLHGSAFPEHEKAAVKALSRAGFQHAVRGSEVSPFIHFLKRTRTALAEAYLSPVFNRFLKEIEEFVPAGQFYLVDSTGGLKASEDMRAVDGLVSGPAAGVLASIRLARCYGLQKIITFDMGGTSTDVARYDGKLDLKYEHSVGGLTLSLPSVALETVAAGGGSVCRIQDGLPKAGPESAGADPGPAGYGKNGPLTLTDINLLLGRLRPEAFRIPVRVEDAMAAFVKLFPDVAEHEAQAFLKGITAVADEKMAEAIRNISIRQGYKPSDYVLTAFGGAGGLHACAVADLLDIQQILFPADAGIFSATGISEASLQFEDNHQILEPLSFCRERLKTLLQERIAHVGAAFKDPETEVRFALRLPGQSSFVEVVSADPDQLEHLFEARYRQQFGYAPGSPDPEVEWMRLFVRERSVMSSERYASPSERKISLKPAGDSLFGQTLPPWLFRTELAPGDEVDGPLVICDELCTVYIAAGWTAVVGTDRSIVCRKRKSKFVRSAEKIHENVALELFINRFRAVVSEMGEQLRRTSVSVNVKERLDFSCALFDTEGMLVANAPHIPVHLGALGPCVRAVSNLLTLAPGDIALTNHPGFGGSHLPDLTLIAPVFDAAGTKLGYLANRAHHAELGGKTPGSMPADAQHLEEEGVIFEPIHIVKNGVFQRETFMNRLHQARYPSRNPVENEADLLAGIAAIETGRKQLLALAETSGTAEVRRFMQELRIFSKNLTETALHELLEDNAFHAFDHLDDGTPLQVRIYKKDNRFFFDFTGSGATHPGNLNANPAIVSSVVMYVLRLLLKKDIPLNEGILEAVKLVIPTGTILNPDFSDPLHLPAVVGGNTETSQKLTTCLLRALGIVAGSQATMNNVLFGNGRFGYYETLGGGSGAGNGFDGADAVHTHMTNTALTDTEILERRYPVTVLEHSIRRGSGGNGKYKGGEGMRRVLQFNEPLTLSILAESRKEAPFGAQGGGPGAVGTQSVFLPGTGNRVLSGRESLEVPAGTRLTVETPGGGGFGNPA